jgi:hypothetical protein
MLLLSSRMFCQEFQWPENYKYWVSEPDTSLVISDSTLLMYESITYMLADSIASYTTYYNSPDTIKVVLMVSDDLEDYSEEELTWYAPGVYIEKGYVVNDGKDRLFLNKRKREYKDIIIWDWREYEWR